MFGRIVARQPDTDAAVRAGDVVYTARCQFPGSQVSYQIVGTKPVRPFDDDEMIHPVKVGSPCVMGKIGGLDIIMVFEKAALEECIDE